MQLYDLDIRLKILALVTALVFVVLVINLVRRRRLRENFALLWISFTVIVVLLALNFNFVRLISKLLGVGNPNNTVFFLSILFLILSLIMVSIEISDLHTKVKNLIQEVSLLKSETRAKDRDGG